MTAMNTPLRGERSAEGDSTFWRDPDSVDVVDVHDVGVVVVIVQHGSRRHIYEFTADGRTPEQYLAAARAAAKDTP